jgi:hypothetical protein
MIRIQNLIDGRLVNPTGDAWLDDVNPATGEVFAQVPDSGIEASFKASSSNIFSWLHSRILSMQIFRSSRKVAGCSGPLSLREIVLVFDPSPIRTIPLSATRTKADEYPRTTGTVFLITFSFRAVLVILPSARDRRGPFEVSSLRG